jgi:hypothetical protein
MPRVRPIDVAWGRLAQHGLTSLVVIAFTASCARPNPAFTSSPAGEDASTEESPDAAEPVDNDRAATIDTGSEQALPADAPAPLSDLATVRGDASAPDAVVPAPDRPSADARSSSCADPALALCLRFEGAVTDESFSKLRVTKTQALSYVAGADGVALSMTSSSLLRLASSAALCGPAFSIEVDLRPRTLPGGSARVGLVDNEGCFGLFVHPGGRVRCSIGDADLDVADLVKVGRWSHIACNVDDTTVSLWIDGVLKGQRGRSGVTKSSASELVVGGNFPTSGSSSPDAFDGLLDDLRVWKRARTAGELCRDGGACAP